MHGIKDIESLHPIVIEFIKKNVLDELHGKNCFLRLRANSLYGTLNGLGLVDDYEH
jgi:hypothetical protein